MIAETSNFPAPTCFAIHLRLHPGQLNLQQGKQGQDTVRYTLSREQEGGIYCLGIPSQLNGSPRQSPWIVIDIAKLTDPVDVSPDEYPADVCSGKRSFHDSSSASPTVYLDSRSVEDIFQYLGRMLTFSPSERALPFYIDKGRPRNPMFDIDYRGKTYDVAESFDLGRIQDLMTSPFSNGACRSGLDDSPDGYHRRDETLFILSILNQYQSATAVGRSRSPCPVSPPPPAASQHL